MTSSPPSARDTQPSVHVRLDEVRFRATAADEPLLFFCVEGAPRSACHTRTEEHLTFETALSGRVTSVTGGELALDVGGGEVLVRYLLPSAVELEALVGHTIGLRVTQRYSGPGRATIDAEVRDSAGGLVLWAHDGRMPGDRLSHGLALRLRLDAGGAHRLALGHGAGVTAVGAPDSATIQVAGAEFGLGVVRVGADDVAFVLVHR